MNKYLEKVALSGSVQAHLKDIKGNTKKRKVAAGKERAAEKDIQKIMNEMAQRIKKTKTSEEEYKNVLKGTESLGKLYTTLKKGNQQAQTKTASWKDFTGGNVRDNQREQEILSNVAKRHGNKPVRTVARKVQGESTKLKEARNKIRMKVGAGTAVAAAGIGYGVKKYKEKQEFQGQD